MAPVRRFASSPRTLAITFCGEFEPPKKAPPNFENKAESPPLVLSEEATVSLFRWTQWMTHNPFFLRKRNSSLLQLIFYFLNLIWNFANFFSAIYRGSAACAAIFFFDYFLFTLHTEREREDVCFDHSWMGVRCTCACVCVLCACCNAVCYVIASNFHNFTVTFFLPSILLTRSQRSVNHSRMLLLFFVSKSLIRNEI